MDANTVHGLLNAVSVCGCLPGSPCSLPDDPGAHGNGLNGAMQTRASRHGVKAEAGRQGMARPAQAVVAKTGRQVKLAGLLSRSGGSWRECGGAGHSEGGLGPTLLSPSQPIAFACLCPYPLPQFAKNQI